MIDCRDIIEYDLNPFFEFDRNGKILNANLEAEFLLSKVDKGTLFDLAVSNAPMNFGFINKFIELEFHRINFYAISIGYNDEESIFLRLYRIASNKKNLKNDFNESVNLYELVDLSISSTMINNMNLKVERIFDPTIPNFKINTNKLLLILNKILESFLQQQQIYVHINLKVGEYLKLDDKKYQVIAVKVKSDKRDDTIDVVIDNICNRLSIYPVFQEDSITLELPLVQ